MKKIELKNLIREEIGKILNEEEELESVKTILNKINNALKAGAVSKNIDGDDYIIFPHRTPGLPAQGFTIEELGTITAILSTYPDSMLATGGAPGNVVNIKLIK